MEKFDKKGASKINNIMLYINELGIINAFKNIMLNIFFVYLMLEMPFIKSYFYKRINKNEKDKTIIFSSLIILSSLVFYIFGFNHMPIYMGVLILGGKLLGRNVIFIGVIIMLLKLNFYTDANFWLIVLRPLFLSVIFSFYYSPKQLIEKKFIDIKKIMKIIILSFSTGFVVSLIDFNISNIIINSILTFMIYFYIENKSYTILCNLKKQKLLNHYKSFDTYKKINKEIMKNFNLDETYEKLLEIGCEEMKIKKGGIFIYNAKQMNLELKNIKGLNNSYIRKVEVMPSLGVLGELFSNGKISDNDQSICVQKNIINKLGKNYDICEILIEEEYGSLYAINMKIEERPIGIMFFMHEDEDFFNNEKQTFIDGLAGHAPLMIQKAEVVEKLEKNNNDLMLLQETGKLLTSTLDLNQVCELSTDVIAGTLGTSFTTIYLINGDNEIKLNSKTNLSQELENFENDILNYTKSIAKKVWSNKKTIVEKNNIIKCEELIEAKLTIATPLLFKEKVLGIVISLQFNSDRLFEDFEISFLEILSNQISTSIDNAQSYEKMQELAIKDGLTKLYNHSYFQKQLEKEIQRVKRSEKNISLSLILTDIDNFKSFNDTYGHQIGDLVLREMSKEISNNVRTNDVVARYGGEEFVIILPNTNKEGAMKMSEKINSLIRDLTIKTDDLELSVTLSSGVSLYNQKDSQKDLIEKADQGLYEAKRNGKDQSCFKEELN